MIATMNPTTPSTSEAIPRLLTQRGGCQNRRLGGSGRPLLRRDHPRGRHEQIGLALRTAESLARRCVRGLQVALAGATGDMNRHGAGLSWAECLISVAKH